MVGGDAKPEKMTSDFTAYASRRLNEAGLDPKDRNRWSRHGSTKYVWDATYLRNAVHYALNRQGEPMQRCAADPSWLK